MDTRNSLAPQQRPYIKRREMKWGTVGEDRCLKRRRWIICLLDVKYRLYFNSCRFEWLKYNRAVKQWIGDMGNGPSLESYYICTKAVIEQNS